LNSPDVRINRLLLGILRSREVIIVEKAAANTFWIKNIVLNGEVEQGGYGDLSRQTVWTV
jgi:hypothetical protein